MRWVLVRRGHGRGTRDSGLYNPRSRERDSNLINESYQPAIAGSPVTVTGPVHPDGGRRGLPGRQEPRSRAGFTEPVALTKLDGLLTTLHAKMSKPKLIRERARRYNMDDDDESAAVALVR